MSAAAVSGRWIELSEQDADRMGVRHRDLVELDWDSGRTIARARVTGIRQGMAHVPVAGKHHGPLTLRRLSRVPATPA